MVKSSLFKFVIPYPGSAVTCSFVTPDFYRGLDQIRAADKFISFFPSMFIVRNTLPFLWCRKFRAQTASPLLHCCLYHFTEVVTLISCSSSFLDSSDITNIEHFFD